MLFLLLREQRLRAPGDGLLLRPLRDDLQQIRIEMAVRQPLESVERDGALLRLDRHRLQGFRIDDALQRRRSDLHVPGAAGHRRQVLLALQPRQRRATDLGQGRVPRNRSQVPRRQQVDGGFDPGLDLLIQQQIPYPLADSRPDGRVGLRAVDRRQRLEIVDALHGRAPHGGVFVVSGDPDQQLQIVGREIADRPGADGDVRVFPLGCGAQLLEQLHGNPPVRRPPCRTGQAQVLYAYSGPYLHVAAKPAKPAFSRWITGHAGQHAFQFLDPEIP